MEKYNIRGLLLEELIELALEAGGFEDAIKKIGEDAYRRGYVREGLADAVTKRERLYPTALPTEVFKAAIPHPTERDMVKRSVVIITKLKIPVDFTLMGSDNEAVSVNIIFMLAVNGAEHQPIILQRLVEMLSKKESTERVKASITPKEIVNSLIKLLS